MNDKPRLNARLRFWIWLGISSVLSAFLAFHWQAPSIVHYGVEVDANQILVRWSIAFAVSLIGILTFSYLCRHAWKNLPTTKRVWLWLSAAAVTLGMLLSFWQIFDDTLKGQVCALSQALFLVLVWSAIWFAGWLILFSHQAIIRWLFSWRILKRFLLGILAVAVLIATFYVEENWRGKRAWENYRAEWEAKGEKFDLMSFAPPAVPDDQNFAMAPIVMSSYAGRLNQPRDDDGTPRTTNVNRLAMRLERSNFYFTTNEAVGSWQRARLTDLKPWQEYYRTRFITNRWEEAMARISFDPRKRPYRITPPEPTPVQTNETEEVVALDTHEFPMAAQPQSPADDVRLALSRYDQAIEELRMAGERPDSRFPLDYQIVPTGDFAIPYLGALAQVSEVLQLRAVAELQAGQTEPALADVKLILHLAESIRTEPILNSHLSRLAMIARAIQPVWEGLAEHRWSNAQMEELNRQLQKLDLLPEYKLCLQGELATSLGYIEFTRKQRKYDFPYLIFAIWPTGSQKIDRIRDYLPKLPEPIDQKLERLGQALPDDFLDRFMRHLPPDGWYELNKVTLAKIYQEQFSAIAKPEKHLLDRQTESEYLASLDKLRSPANCSPGNVLAGMLLPYLHSSVQRVAVFNNAVDLANVACALERYRHAQGEYPETLVMLAPQFMEKIPPDVVSGQPLHYHRTSDGRFQLYSVGWNGTDDGGMVGLNDRGHVDFKKGDWVWQYPQK